MCIIRKIVSNLILLVTLILPFGSPPSLANDNQDIFASYDFQSTITDYMARLRENNDVCLQSIYVEKYMSEMDNTASQLNSRPEVNTLLINKLESLDLNFDNEIILPTGNAQLDKYTSYLQSHGFKFKNIEGGYFIAYNRQHFVDNFRDALTPLVLDYYTVYANDKNKGYENDAALDVEWDVLRQKILRYEEYANKYKDVECGKYYLTAAENMAGIYLNTYLYGMDNTDIYNYETGTLLEGLKVSYERFIKENKSSKYYDIIHDKYNGYLKNNFRVRK